MRLLTSTITYCLVLAALTVSLVVNAEATAKQNNSVPATVIFRLNDIFQETYANGTKMFFNLTNVADPDASSNGTIQIVLKKLVRISDKWDNVLLALWKQEQAEASTDDEETREEDVAEPIHTIASLKKTIIGLLNEIKSTLRKAADQLEPKDEENEEKFKTALKKFHQHLTAMITSAQKRVQKVGTSRYRLLLDQLAISTRMGVNFDKWVQCMGAPSAIVGTLSSVCAGACALTAGLGCPVCLAGEAGFSLGASAGCAVKSWEW